VTDLAVLDVEGNIALSGRVKNSPIGCINWPWRDSAEIGKVFSFGIEVCARSGI
jgi:hypothetical protein